MTDFALTMKPRAIRRPHWALAALALVGTVQLALAQQVVRPPKTQLWIDLSTGGMAGMPEMPDMGAIGGALGGLGGLLGNRGAAVGLTGLQNYGNAKGMGFMPARVMDVALLNQLKPATEVSQRVPAGAKLGESIPLLPYVRPEAVSKEETRTPGERTERDPERPKGRLLFYWGCSAEVRSGQPRVIDLSKDAGQFAGAFAGRYAPDRDVRVSPQHALYPNEKNKVNLSSGSSLVGEHQVLGDGVPASMRFNLNSAQDLMPPIALQTAGGVQDTVKLNWASIAAAKAYHLSAMGSVGDDMVFWSSAELPDTGMGLMAYLSNATIDQWLRERVLLGPGTTSCDVPRGIFSNQTNTRGSGAMLQMMAYGGESYIVHPPRPTDPKTPWDQEWAVRVRVKAQTMAALGGDAAQRSGRPSRPGNAPAMPTGDAQAPAASPQGQTTSDGPSVPSLPSLPSIPNPVNVLKGIFGR